MRLLLLLLLLSVCVCVLLQLLDAAKVGEYQPGQALDIAQIFKAGDNVDVAGTTVGKGFQGEQQQQQDWAMLVGSSCQR